MTRQADFKRRVRARMDKTGESYSAARAHLLSTQPARAHEASAGALHVTNGDATVPGLRGAGVGGTIIAWRDALHEGPVPDVPDDELRGIRAGFLAGEGGADIGRPRSSLSAIARSPPTAPDPSCSGSRPTCTTSCS